MEGTMELLNKTLNSITRIDDEVAKKAKQELDALAKPLGSLGKLEDIAIKIAAIQGNTKFNTDRKNIIVMAADNGVTNQGVSAAPQSVTALMTRVIRNGVSGVGVLAKHAGADLTVVDIGVNAEINIPGVINKKIAMGTADMSKGPAMTREQAIQGIETGIEIVNKLCDEGYNLLGTGEMGIGNTSTSSAVFSVLSGISIDKAAGMGVGLTIEQYKNKVAVLKRAIEVNNPDKNDPIDVIAKVGGFDIAGLVGCYLGAAYRKVPIVIDGFISSAAALAAYRLKPEVKDYMIQSHLSAEPGAKYVMQELGLSPMLDMNMRLGEGTGCALAFHIVSAAEAIVKNMATFNDIMLDDSFLVDIR